MNHRAVVVTALLSTLLVSVEASAKKTAPIVAVFDIQDRSGKLTPKLLKQLKAYLRSKLAEGGAFQIVPEGELKARLRTQKKDSYKDCYDEKCQVEMGRELAAQKTLSTQIAKVGNECMVMAALYDLKRATAERSATRKGGCGEKEMVLAMEHIAKKLRPKLVAVATPEKKSGGFVLKSEPSGVAVWVDGKKRGETPLTLLKLPPGKHRIKLAGPYHEKELTIDVQADQIAQKRVVLPLNKKGLARKRAKEAEAEKHRRQMDADYQRIKKKRSAGSLWGYTLLTAGLVTVATAGVLYGVGISGGSSATSDYHASNFVTDIASNRDKMESSQTLTNVGHGLAAAGLIATGAALYFLIARPELPAEKKSASLARSFGCATLADGAFCAAGGTF